MLHVYTINSHVNLLYLAYMGQKNVATQINTRKTLPND